MSLGTVYLFKAVQGYVLCTEQAPSCEQIGEYVKVQYNIVSNKGGNMPKLFLRRSDPSGRRITAVEEFALMQACIARDDFYWWCRDFAFSRADLGVTCGRVKIIEDGVFRISRGYVLNVTFLIFTGVRQTFFTYAYEFIADTPEEKRRVKRARSYSERSFVSLIQ